MLLSLNARVNTVNLKGPLLYNIPCFIGPPKPKDLARMGGIVHYVALFDPLINIVAGDDIYIVYWEEHFFSPDTPLKVVFASNAGSIGLSTLRCGLVDKTQR